MPMFSKSPHPQHRPYWSTFILLCSKQNGALKVPGELRRGTAAKPNLSADLHINPAVKILMFLSVGRFFRTCGQEFHFSLFSCLLFIKERFFAHVCVYVNVHTRGCQWRPEEGTGYPGAELQAVMRASLQTWALDQGLYNNSKHFNH